MEIEDEGIQTLKNAMAYLIWEIGDPDEYNEVEGELMHLISQIEKDYLCHECGALVKKKDHYCSRNCYEASQI